MMYASGMDSEPLHRAPTGPPDLRWKYVHSTCADTEYARAPTRLFGPRLRGGSKTLPRSALLGSMLPRTVQLQRLKRQKQQEHQQSEPPERPQSGPTETTSPILPARSCPAEQREPTDTEQGMDYFMQELRDEEDSLAGLQGGHDSDTCRVQAEVCNQDGSGGAGSGQGRRHIAGEEQPLCAREGDDPLAMLAYALADDLEVEGSSENQHFHTADSIGGWKEIEVGSLFGDERAVPDVAQEHLGCEPVNGDRRALDAEGGIPGAEIWLDADVEGEDLIWGGRHTGVKWGTSQLVGSLGHDVALQPDFQREDRAHVQEGETGSLGESESGAEVLSAVGMTSQTPQNGSGKKRDGDVAAAIMSLLEPFNLTHSHISHSLALAAAADAREARAAVAPHQGEAAAPTHTHR